MIVITILLWFKTFYFYLLLLLLFILSLISLGTTHILHIYIAVDLQFTRVLILNPQVTLCVYDNYNEEITTEYIMVKFHLW